MLGPALSLRLEPGSDEPAAVNDPVGVRRPPSAATGSMAPQGSDRSKATKRSSGRWAEAPAWLPRVTPHTAITQSRLAIMTGHAVAL